MMRNHTSSTWLADLKRPVGQITFVSCSRNYVFIGGPTNVHTYLHTVETVVLLGR
jgi:hypothetical protein